MQRAPGSAHPFSTQHPQPAGQAVTRPPRPAPCSHLRTWARRTLSHPRNAYFGLTIHAIPAGWRRVAVVTSKFHMERSKALFDVIWRLAGQSVYGDPNRWVAAASRCLRRGACRRALRRRARHPAHHQAAAVAAGRGCPCLAGWLARQAGLLPEDKQACCRPP